MYRVKFFLALQEMEGERDEREEGVFKADSPEEAIEKCIKYNYPNTQDKDYLRGCLSAKEEQ